MCNLPRSDCRLKKEFQDELPKIIIIDVNQNLGHPYRSKIRSPIRKNKPVSVCLARACSNR